MHINPAGRDYEPGGVNELTAHTLLDQVIAERGDSRPDGSDFDDSIQVLGRIDDPPTAHDHIEHDGYHGALT